MNKNQIDLRNIKSVYFIGIEGAGTSALAVILKRWGLTVSGSDEGDHFYSNNLKCAGIKLIHQFSSDNLPKSGEADLIIYSTSFQPDTNRELKAALEQEAETPVLSYPEALGLFFNQKFGIAVCGTHGKTSTTALIGEVLRSGGLDPTVLVGATVKDWHGATLTGQSEYFILEADEYQNKFQHYTPLGLVLTAVDYDHPDFFPDFDAYKKVFSDFVAKVPGHGFVVACAEDVDVIEVIKAARPKCEVTFYGQFAEPFEEVKLREDFQVLGKEIKIFKTLTDLKLQSAGTHSQLNATAALVVGRKLNLEVEKMKQVLAEFSGTARRFEALGCHQSGALIVDDYAHHPVEVKASLKAARKKYPDKKIICVFHPHTFTRTQALLDDFAGSFEDADEVIILDIYGSVREKQGGISSTDLADKIKSHLQTVKNIATMDEVFADLDGRLGKDDMVITMGAGDVWKLGRKLAGN